MKQKPESSIRVNLREHFPKKEYQKGNEDYFEQELDQIRIQPFKIVVTNIGKEQDEKNIDEIVGN